MCTSVNAIRTHTKNKQTLELKYFRAMQMWRYTTPGFRAASKDRASLGKVLIQKQFTSLNKGDENGTTT